jgi:hypothetical protein
MSTIFDVAFINGSFCWAESGCINDRINTKAIIHMTPHPVGFVINFMFIIFKKLFESTTKILLRSLMLPLKYTDEVYRSRFGMRQLLRTCCTYNPEHKSATQQAMQ